MIWFTSDLHLGHRAAVHMCGRPFETVEEMNETLIHNFNSCVKKSDIVYILGFEGMYDFLQVSLNGFNMSLMHYPMMSWPKSRHGSLHLHGHLHSKPEYNLQQREAGVLRYDVGVDANHFYPVSLEQVKTFFSIE